MAEVDAQSEKDADRQGTNVAELPPDSSLEDRQVTEHHSEPVTGFKLFLIVIGLSISYYLILLNSTVVVTAIPRITSEFNSIEDIGWYGSAYLLANSSLQPLSGRIYTFHSLKKTFLSFLFVFELGSLICGVSKNSKMFIVGRAIAGSGASGIINGAMTIIAAAASPAKRAYLTGFIISFGTLGQVSGPLIGGVLTQYVTWRWSFYINLPVGGATALLFLLIRIPEQRNKEKSTSWRATLQRLDLGGFVTFAPSVIMLLLALDWGGSTYAWHSATVIGLFCGAAGLFCVFLVWENRQGKEAMVPLHMLRQKIIASSYWTGFFQAGALAEMTYFLPVWFQSVKQDTPTKSGINILPTVGSQICLAAISGLLVSRLGYYLPFAVFGSAITAIGAGLMTRLLPTSPTKDWVGYQILTGGGRGMSIQQPVTAVQAILSGDEIATGTSLLAFSQYLGGAIFASCANTLFINELAKSIKMYAPDVNASTIVQAGASGIANVIPPNKLAGVLEAFNHSITRTFYLAAGAGAVAALTSLGMGWVNVKKVKEMKAKAKSEATANGTEIRPDRV